MKILSTRLFPPDNPSISGLSQSMDIVIVNGNIIYNTSLKQARTVYMDIRTAKRFLNINLLVNVILQKINQKINVIIAGEDTTYPNSIDLRHEQSPWLIKELHSHKYVNKIFIENLDSYVNKSEPLPLGINPKLCSTDWEYFSNYEKIDPGKQLKAVNFNVVRESGQGQWADRFCVKRLCETSWRDHYLPVREDVSHQQYLDILSNNMFSVCVHGGGLDPNPKLWESLLVGSIPIIHENKPHTDIYVELDLPVVIIKDWSSENINNEKLKFWRDKYYDHFLNKQKRDDMLKKLSIDFWVKRVSHI